MRILYSATGVLACIVCVGTSPASAGTRTATKFVLQGTNGYEVTVYAADQGTARLVAARRHAVASYTTDRAYFDGSRLTAEFADLGSVSVEFRPSLIAGRPLPARSRVTCALEESRARRGLFVGRVQFRGERGFTKLDATHARGVVYWLRRDGCDGRQRVLRSRQKEASRPGGPVLRAFGVNHGALVFFRAGRNAFEDLLHEKHLEVGKLRKDGVPFSVQTFEERQGIGIVRTAVAKGPQSSFVFNHSHTAAKISPPAPFSGRGHFSNCKMSHPRPWYGSLSVFLPGRGRLPLASQHTMPFTPILHPVKGCPRKYKSPS